jgi:hypothetical protein
LQTFFLENPISFSVSKEKVGMGCSWLSAGANSRDVIGGKVSTCILFLSFNHSICNSLFNG